MDENKIHILPIYQYHVLFPRKFKKSEEQMLHSLLYIYDIFDWLKLVEMNKNINQKQMTRNILQFMFFTEVENFQFFIYLFFKLVRVQGIFIYMYLKAFLFYQLYAPLIRTQCEHFFFA